MNKLNKLFLYVLSGCIFTFTACDDDGDVIPTYTSDFEDQDFPEGADAYYGQDLNGEELGDGLYAYTYQSGPGIFSLTYNENYNSWSGVAYSRQTDNTLSGPEGQFVAMPGEGANGSDVYAIMNGSSTVAFEFEEGANPQSIQVTNNAYVYHSIQEGDQFAKKFGGPEGNDQDFFKLIITGLDEDGEETGEVEFYLADYRFDDNSQDYIVDSWETVDLSPLGSVQQLTFSLESTDVGEWGMNTPAYFSFDKLVVQRAETE